MKNLTKPIFRSNKAERPIEIKPFLYRALIAFISASWFGFLPMYFTMIYMAEKRFFSYEFISEDAFGMRTLIVAEFIFLFFVSLFLFGFIILFKAAIIEEKRTGKYGDYRWLTWALFFTASIMHYQLFYSLLQAEKPNIYLGISFFSLFVCIYLSSFIGEDIKKKLSNWIPTAAFIGVTAFLPFVFRNVTADLIEISLQQFRVGGEIPVNIINKANKESIIKGKLLLRTTRHFYIITEQEAGKKLTIIHNNADLYIESDNPASVNQEKTPNQQS
ncbi:MAG: hypothetical protein Q4F13_09010 [Pseudomonadota bacterium]|nr:hypothetical protein [Pseudomonadota bacterium]